MSSYRQHWIQALKNQQIPNWDIMEHGQAIVIKVPQGQNREALTKEFNDTITTLSSNVNEPKEWLKFILYNSTFWSQYILKP